jgi:hypothetical protein
MRSNASDEVAQLVHEDIPRSKKLLRQIHNYARDPLIGQAFGPKGMTPFTHIRGPIYFAEKHEERLLQLADACAYIICRYLNGYDDISDLFASLRPQIVAWADDDRETPHQPKTRRRHGGER